MGHDIDNDDGGGGGKNWEQCKDRCIQPPMPSSSVQGHRTPPLLLKLMRPMTWYAWCVGMYHFPTWVTVLSVSSPAKMGDDRDKGRTPAMMGDDRDKGRARDGSMVV